MRLSKWKSYFLLLTFELFLILSYQSIWLFSKSTEAFVIEVELLKERWGKRKLPSQTILVEYLVADSHYTNRYLEDNRFSLGDTIKIRYLIFNPSFSRQDTFKGNWAALIIIFIMCFVSTTIIFLSKGIINKSDYLEFSFKRPFIRLTLFTR